jgi:DUF3027 family protein
VNEPRSDGPSLVDDPGHAAECHERWLRRSDYLERGPRWRGECLWCRFYIPLAGALADDWGVCSNPASPNDGRVMFEHDGCAEFSPADEVWSPGGEPSTPEEQQRANAEALRIWLERQGLPPDHFGPG